MGGTGKTPMVALLASALLAKNLKPAIISRGYGGATGEKVNVVSDGDRIFMDARVAGDEPCFLAKNLPGVAVLTGVVRILPCRYAVEKLGCNVLILDDGFQHMAVARDLDLVLFSAASLAGNSRVFPGGDLREPVNALKRCNAFVITGVTDTLKLRARKFGELLKNKFPDKQIFFTAYGATAARSLAGGKLNLPELPAPLYAFCGIAQPELFENSLMENNIPISGFKPLKDHQVLTPSLIKSMEQQARNSGAKGIMTTEKDMIKLQKNTFSLPCFSLRMKVTPDTAFETFFRDWITTTFPPS